MHPPLYARVLICAIGAWLLCSALVSAQPAPIAPDLAGALGEKGWKLINRSAAVIDKDGAKAIRLEGEGGAGFVRLEQFTFGNGMIEFDARGKNEAQRSFLGLAFHGADAKTYDAIYFRPFNFKADDPARRQRAVQYISHPAHTWQKLRSEHPGKYEKPVAPVPDPDRWFHVRVVVAWPKVSVFVEAAVEPCLVVEQLSDRKGGWLALWTDVAGGDFANLRIAPAH